MTPEALTTAVADRNVRLFVAFRILFNIRFYYPVFMVMFLRYGITLEQFGLLNAAWAVVIVLLEVPSGALADLVGRKALLVAAAVMMALEMLLLAIVPVDSSWVLPALLLNRVLSGAAEAFASGADEALAFDSLKAAGRDNEWPRVLERLMQFGGLATIVAMITGSLVYSPDLFNTVGVWLGQSPGLTFADTFRLPVWLTFFSACGAIGVTLAMQEPRDEAAAATGRVGLLEPFQQTIRTGGWILANPLVLVVIAAGVLFDQPIRQLLVVSSQLYARIDIPELLFGVISATTAVIGLFAATPMRRLATAQSPRALLAARRSRHHRPGRYRPAGSLVGRRLLHAALTIDAAVDVSTKPLSQPAGRFGTSGDRTELSRVGRQRQLWPDEPRLCRGGDCG